MIKANELRIGNIVKGVKHLPYIEDTEGCTAVISEISSSRTAFKCASEYNAASYVGMELNEEWLLKFGFEKFVNSKLYKLEYFKVHYDSDIEAMEVNYRGLYFHLKYVHQLQNLYFTLTGEELTLKNNS